MGSPTVDPCHCRPGYKCPSCEQAEKREAKHDAERRRVEQLRDGGETEEEEDVAVEFGDKVEELVEEYCERGMAKEQAEAEAEVAIDRGFNDE